MKKFQLLVALLLMSASSFAVVYSNSVNWSTANGDWMTEADWDTETLGDGGEWAIPGWVVGNPYNTGGSTNPDWNDAYAHIDSGICNVTPASCPDGTVRKLYIGSEASAATLNISTDLTIREQSYFGYQSSADTTATINQTAGNVIFGTHSTTATRRIYWGRGNGASVYNLSGGTLTTAGDEDYMGLDGDSSFTLNQTGGTYNDTGSQLQFGRGSTAPGTYHLSAGVFDANSLIYLGVYGRGEIYQTGGVFSANAIFVGGTTSSACAGFLEISGGEFDCRKELLVRYRDAKMVVSGSGATSITTKKFSLNGAKTLGIELDGDGSTLIAVTGLETESYHGAFLAGGTLEVDILAGFDGVVGDVYDVLWSAAELTTTGLALNNLSGVNFTWKVVDKDGGKMLQLVILDDSVVDIHSPFKIVALPDTQYYSESSPATFTAQTQWIVNHVTTQNIGFVTHLGDVVDNSGEPTQWVNADNSMDLLDGVVPYSVCVGNHDYHDLHDKLAGAEEFISYFGHSRYPYFWYGGGHRRGLSHYQSLSVEGQEWIHLNLEFQADDEVLQWAQRVLDAHPDSPVILSTHSYLSDTGLWAATATGFGASKMMNGGESQFRKFVSQNDQIFMVLNGHHADYGGVAMKTSQNSFGNDVFQLCSDYQYEDNSGNGYLRTYGFDLTNDVVNVETYSPTLNSYLTDPNNQFTLSIDFDTRFNFSSRELLGTVQAGNIVVTDNVSDANDVSVTLAIPAGESTSDFSLIAPGTTPFFASSNRGDYFVQAGSIIEDDALSGIFLASVAETSRYDVRFGGDVYHTIGMDVGNMGQSSVSVARTSSAVDPNGGLESNVNCAVAYFPFSGGWTCGRLVSPENGEPAAAFIGSDDIILGQNLVQLGQNTVADPNINLNKPNGNTWAAIDSDRGIWNLTIPGVDSIGDGVLLVCSGLNEDNYACASPWTNGSGWQMAIRDNGTEGANTESDPINFVYVPYETEGIVAGRISGRGGILNGTGGFRVENAYQGGHRLYIDGYTPADGALVVSTELEWYNDDDFNTYRPESDHWVIENRDLKNAVLAQSTEAQYVFVFIPFGNSPAEPGPSRDFDYTEVLAANFETTWDSAQGIVNVQKLQGSSGYSTAWHEKGEYFQSVNGNRRERMNDGTTFATMREFSRNDGDTLGTYRPTISTREYNWVGCNAPYGDGTVYAEWHGNGSFASVWIPKGSGYSWGDVTTDGDIYVNGTYGAIQEGSAVTITPSYMGQVGRYKYVFNDFTPADGVLFTISRTAASGMTSVMPLADGWEVTMRTNVSDLLTYKAHWARYAFFPFETEGKNTVAQVDADGTVVQSSAPVTVTKTDVGTYTVDVFGGSPDEGALLLTCYDGDPNGTGGASNCYLAYEPDGDSFTVKCFKLDEARPESDQDFALAYIPFDRSVFFDGSADLVDFSSFAQSWLAAEIDENYNPKWDLDDSGAVDILDLQTFMSCWLRDP